MGLHRFALGQGVGVALLHQLLEHPHRVADTAESGQRISGWQLALRRHFIDHGREGVGELLRDYVGRNAELGREALQDIGTEHLLKLLSRDRQILSTADPRLDDVSQSSLVEELGQACQPTDTALTSQHVSDTVQQIGV